MKTIFLHGLESTPETSRSAKAIKSAFSEVEVLNYKPNRSYLEVRKELSLSLVDVSDECVVIGISIGGFWALKLPEFTNIRKVILLNPAIDRGKQLYGVNCAIGSEVWGHVILNMNDIIVDNKLNYTRFQGAFKVDTFPSGGHSMDNMDQVLPLIEATLDHYKSFIL